MSEHDSPAAAKGSEAGERNGSNSGTKGGASKSPVQIQIPNTEERTGFVKAFTVYIIHISDFGRNYQVERRFDDFAKLHGELSEVDPGLPPIPEKKMWASTDASTVAERRPAFERILRYMLASEAVMFEKGQALWKFLEIPPPGMVAARYAFGAQRLSYARQCGKLLDPKYEKEHAYRLAHDSIIRSNLHVLLVDLKKGPSSSAIETGSAGPATSPSNTSFEASLDGGEGAAEEDAGASASASTTATGKPHEEAEAAALEMLRWAISNGGQVVRRCFLEQKGLFAMLDILLRKGRAALSPDGPPSGPAALPHPQIRSVMNALVKAEGENYPKVFCRFLETGGVALLDGARDLLQANAAYAEFISKLLWISWEEETQRAFLDENHGKVALGLLAALFASSSRIARVCAGLLVSSLLATELLGEKAGSAASGVHRLVEDMVGTPVNSGEGKSTNGSSSDAEFANFLTTLGQNEERFARILDCVSAPWRGGSFPHKDHPLWASCSFGLWCLQRIAPKASQLSSLRPALPALARSHAPGRVRWLAGELILQLQTQAAAQHRISDADDSGSGQGMIETTVEESIALEAILREQLLNSRHQLQSDVEESHEVLATQKALIAQRQEPPNFSKSVWHQPFEGSLKRLTTVRGTLSTSLDSSEQRREKALTAVRSVLQLDLDGSDNEAERRALSVKLEGMREVEVSFLNKRQQVQEGQESVKGHEEHTEQLRQSMEHTDQAVQTARQAISELEQQINSKYREAQHFRTMASSDVSARRRQLEMDLDLIKGRQTELRERAARLKNGEPLEPGMQPLLGAPAHEEMDRMKAESQKLKARAADLNNEIGKLVDSDPASLERQALAADESVQQLSEERDALRAELPRLEAEHSNERSGWQAALSQLQSARQTLQMLERECSGLKQQLDSGWSSWQPLWSKRLNVWKERMKLLKEAQQGSHQLAQAVGEGWESLRDERQQRQRALEELRELRANLNELEEELLSLDDKVLGDFE
mmetsp:Transcript_94921/g.207588  ORF Transcript_94921/g.207588 Transcript_94921/m.207588 type:complete len:1000 (+) Transcript_94921:35-3034(+)